MRQKAEMDAKNESGVRKCSTSKTLMKTHALGTQTAAGSLLTLQQMRGNRFVQNLLKDAPHKCGCGASGGSEKCDSCSKKQPSKWEQFAMASSYNMNSRSRNFLGKPSFYHNSLKAGPPSKAVGVSDERDELKPRPYQAGGATIECNGSGDYHIVYNNYAGAACGTKSCVTAHESTHIADWKSKWPNGCKGQAAGYLPKGDPPDSPLMTVAEYNKFRNDSECKAHTADIECAERLPKPAGCKATVEAYIKLTKKQKEAYDCGMSTGAKVFLGLLGLGALIGGGLLYAKYG